jgi:hypothetical protein
MHRTARGGLLTEDDRHILEPCGIGRQHGAGHGGCRTAVAGFGKGQEDETVLAEGRPKADIEQAALSAGPHGWHALKRGGERAAGRNDPQPARPLCHQHAAIGQEAERPRVFQPGSHGFEPQGTCAGGVALRDALCLRGRGDKTGEEAQSAAAVD